MSIASHAVTIFEIGLTFVAISYMTMLNVWRKPPIPRLVTGVMFVGGVIAIIVGALLVRFG